MRQWARRGKKPGKSFLEIWEEEWAGIAEHDDGDIRQISRPGKNKQLAEEAASLWKLAKEMRGGKLWLAMVRAHGERRGGVRHEHNHAVDRLAADGADGRVLSRADLAAGARD